MAMKDEIRPIYAELQGCLSQAPTLDMDMTYCSVEVSQHVDRTIDELSDISGEDYSRFKMAAKESNPKQQCVDTDIYRTKLGGLISRLHGKYFSDELPPFSGMPQMVNIQTQQQSQSVHIQMEIIEQLTRSEAKFQEGSKERGFIDKVKDHLKSAVSATTGVAQLMLLLLNLAKECGLNVEDMQRVFGG